MGVYEPLIWQIGTDRLGYGSIYETNENGGLGDIIAEVYGDHTRLIAAAPDLHSASTFALGCLETVQCYFPDGSMGAIDIESAIELLRAAIAKANTTGTSKLAGEVGA